MIVARRPSLIGLFSLRGSVLPSIASRVLVVMVIALILAWLRRTQPGRTPDLSAIPFTLISLALSIFLGFRNNACYDRWWEGRRLWGQLVVETRSLARDCLLLPEEVRDLAVRRAIAFCCLLRARLREVTEPMPASLPSADADRVGQAQNPPGVVLADIMQQVVDCARAGTVSDYVAAVFTTRLANISGIQAACERLLNTPMPFAYTLLLHRTAWLFCLLLPFGLVTSLGFATPAVAGILAYAFFGLDALSDELEAPFGGGLNDLPLDAIVRTIERDLLESLGETDLPPALVPINGVLT